jgi:hypothetical protein
MRRHQESGKPPAWPCEHLELAMWPRDRVAATRCKIAEQERVRPRPPASHLHLWHGYVGVGKATALRLHEQLGIPLEELIRVDPVPAVKQPRTTPPRPRGRPRKSPSTEVPDA